MGQTLHPFRPTLHQQAGLAIINLYFPALLARITGGKWFRRIGGRLTTFFIRTVLSTPNNRSTGQAGQQDQHANQIQR